MLLDNIATMRAVYLYLSIIFFSFLALILVISMVIIMLGKKNNLKKESLIISRLEGWIMDIILENNIESNHVFAIPGDVGILLQTLPAKNVLLSELIKVKKSLSGISGDNLEKLYNQLGLYDLSLKRVASKLWHIKAKGIQELAIMNQQVNHTRIFELTNDKDAMVRMEAQTAMVRLQGFKGLHFFNDHAYPISEWHQLNLLQLIVNQPITSEDGIINWLHSSNNTVVQFSLKLIAEQYAIEFHDQVVNCLQHTSEIVRREAILCLGQMPSPAAAEALVSCYSTEPEKNIRLCIINELKKAGSDQDLAFLQTLTNSQDVDIKLAANKTVLYLQKNY